MRQLFVFIIIVITYGTTATAQTAQIQFIHNSPDRSIGVIDILIDNQSVVQNLEFKSGTPFLEIPFSNDQVFIQVTNPNNQNEILLEQSLFLVNQERYYIVINGVHDTSSYSGIESLALFAYEGARITSFYTDPSINVDILTHHGALGFSHELDVQGTQLLAFPLEFGESLAYGDYSESSEESLYTAWASDTDIAVEIADFNGIAGNQLSAFYYTKSLEFGAPGFPDYSEQAIIMLLTGFETPEDYTDGEPFDAYLLGPDGGAFQPFLSVNSIVFQKASLFPNPFNETIRFESTQEFDQYTVFDLKGSVVIKEELGSRKRHEFNFAAIPSGLYFLEIRSQTNNTSITKRIIKR